MSTQSLSYKFSNVSILLTVISAIGLSYFFKWTDLSNPVDFMGGDAKDYYSYLVATFINHDFLHQSGQSWFILKTDSGIINVHSVGVSLLLLPFFAIAYFYAQVFDFPLDGFSYPFQVSVGLAALLYAVIGLVYLKKLFQLNNISDKTSSIIILLIFFGTNLIQYTLSEAGMSHVYSFSLISIFLFHSCKFVLTNKNKNLFFSGLILGLILLVRPNNIFIIFSVFIWFKNMKECKLFFYQLFRNKLFYFSFLATVSLVFIQSAIWFLQSNSFFHNTYKADGFYWLKPQIFQMLFGFEAGFFVYTPLCFLFLIGLVVIYRENKFSFFALLALLVGLIYFFASFWAYTYFDGLGIRILVDYYALFAFLGAKLFMYFSENKLVYYSVLFLSFVLVYINLIYCYQGNRGILLRSGMNFKKWKYVFLKTDASYQNCLGGSSDLKPFSIKPAEEVLSGEQQLSEPLNYNKKEYGLNVIFDSIAFVSNRIQLAINFSRTESYINSSKDALICVSLDDNKEKKNKSFFTIKLNEIPSSDCCSEKEYNYTANMNAAFKPNDRLSVFIWNTKLKAFFINKFSVKVYNYNYHIN